MVDEIEKINGKDINVSVPLEEWVEEIAKKAGQEAAQAVLNGDVWKSSIGRVVSSLRLRFYILVAFLTGLGLLKIGTILLR